MQQNSKTQWLAKGGIQTLLFLEKRKLMIADKPDLALGNNTGFDPGYNSLKISSMSSEEVL